MKQFDFAPLAQKVTFADAKPYIWASVRRSYIRYILAFIIILAIILSTVITSEATVLYAKILFGTFVLVALISCGVILKAARDKVKIKRFADGNNIAVRLDINEPGYSGLYFEQGHSRRLVAALDIADENIELGSYQYTTGSGRSRKDHRIGFAKRKLSRRLPHMVLDNKQNNFWKVSNLPAYFDNNQKLSLEGNFDERFTLYAPKQYERDALYIFTPDVMATFIDNGYAFDAEIVDDCLYIYTDKNSNLTDENFLQTIYSAISVLGNKLENQSGYYKDERVETRAENSVAPQGKRLKPGLSWIAIFFVVNFILFQIINFMQTTTDISAIKIVPVAITTAIVVAILWSKYGSAKK